MKLSKGKVKLRAKCFNCNRTWVLVNTTLDKMKQFALGEIITCPHCGYENKQSELKMHSSRRF